MHADYYSSSSYSYSLAHRCSCLGAASGKGLSRCLLRVIDMARLPLLLVQVDTCRFHKPNAESDLEHSLSLPLLT